MDAVSNTEMNTHAGLQENLATRIHPVNGFETSSDHYQGQNGIGPLFSEQLFFRCDASGKILFMDAAASSSEGADNCWLNQNISALLPGDWAEQVYSALTEVIGTQTTVCDQYHWTEGSKSQWIEFQILPLDMDCVGVLLRDISSQKQMELTYKVLQEDLVSNEENAYFSRLALQIAIALNVTEVRITHLSDDELQALAWVHQAIDHPEQTYSCHGTPCGEALAQGSYSCPQNVQDQFPDDVSLRTFDAQSYVGVALYSSDGQRLGTVCCLNQSPLANVDFAISFLEMIAKRIGLELERRQGIQELERLNIQLEKRVEQRTQALQRSEQDLRTIFNTAYDGIYIHEFDGTIVDVNDRALEMHGLTRDQLLELTVADFSEESPERAAEVQSLLGRSARGETLRFEWKGRNFKDPTRPIDNEVALRKALLSDREVVIATLRDVSERKQRELAMKTIIEGTAMKSGFQFYQTCVNALAEIFHVPCAFLMEVKEDQSLHAIALSQEQPGYLDLIVELSQCTLAQSLKLFISNDISIYVLNNPNIQAFGSFVGVQIRDSQDQILGVVGIIADYQLPKNIETTRFIVQLFAKHVAGEMEREIAAATLRKSQEQLLSFVDYSPARISIKDLRGQYLLCNRVLARQFQLSPQQVIGKTDLDLYPPDIAESICQHDQLIYQQGEAISVEGKIALKDGSQRPCLITKFPLLDIYGQPYAIGSIATDISELKKAEQELYKSRQILRTVLDTIPISVFWQDTAFEVIGCNQYFLERFGYDRPAQVVGKNYSDITQNDNESFSFQEIGEAVLESHAPSLKTVMTMIQEDGQTQWLETNHVPLYNPEQDVIGILRTSQDITLQKQAEETLRNLNEELEERVEKRTEELQLAIVRADCANKAKSEFLANMSHELRTPLNGVLGYTQILQRSKSLQDREKHGLDIIHQCSSHLLTLINDILDVSKIEAQKLELNPTAVHLPSFLIGIVEICKVRIKIDQVTFDVNLPHDLPEYVEVDEKRLRQILLNLLSNAIKFTDSGCVRFNVSWIDDPASPPELHSQELMYDLRFEVEDSGIGIAEEQIERLFTPFEQVGDRARYTEGTGLGLAISQRIARMMNSDIKVRSEINVGSCFSFDLSLPPIQFPVILDDNETGHTPGILGYEGQRQKILLIDDRWENRSVFLNLLEPLGFIVDIAENGQLGLSKLGEMHPSLVLLDLAMPIMDGFEFLASLRSDARWRDLKVIVASASASSDEMHKSLEAGADDYLSKPVSSEELFSLLQKHLQLTWKYEDIFSKEETPVLEMPEKILSPPPNEILQQMLPLAQSGRLKKLCSLMNDYAQSLDPVFVQRIDALVREFDSETIEEMIAGLMNAT